MTLPDISVDQIARSTETLFVERDGYWPRSLVDVLESYQPGLALKWAVQLFQELSTGRARVDTEAQQRGWLDELGTLMHCEEVGDHCAQMVYQIWHNDTNFNSWERAIARLYLALKLMRESDAQGYRGAVIQSIVMLAEGPEAEDSWNQSTMEEVIVDWRRFVGRLS